MEKVPSNVMVLVRLDSTSRAGGMVKPLSEELLVKERPLKPERLLMKREKMVNIVAVSCCDY